MPRYERPAIGEYLSLTPRERQILIDVADGYSDVEIAKRLCRSVATVRMHLRALRLKLKARNRVMLTRLAVDARLVGAPHTAPVPTTAPSRTDARVRPIQAHPRR